MNTRRKYQPKNINTFSHKSMLERVKNRQKKEKNMKKKIRIPRNQIKGIIKKKTQIEISRDVIECICEQIEDQIEEITDKLSEEVTKENDLREKCNLKKIKRIDINLFKNISARHYIDNNRFNNGDTGQYNRDTVSCRKQKKRGIPNV